jgi:hypothetical protein
MYFLALVKIWSVSSIITFSLFMETKASDAVIMSAVWMYLDFVPVMRLGTILPFSVRF